MLGLVPLLLFQQILLDAAGLPSYVPWCLPLTVRYQGVRLPILAQMLDHF